jgi:hypothetical protein
MCKLAKFLKIHVRLFQPTIMEAPDYVFLYPMDHSQ